MLHLRLLGALLAFVVIAQCQDPNPGPPQPTPDPGPGGLLLEAEHPREAEEQQFDEIRL